jgi:hypothetical protein
MGNYSPVQIGVYVGGSVGKEYDLLGATVDGCTEK